MALEEEDVHEAQHAVVKVVLASLMSFSLSRANHFWSLVVDGARANGCANVADVSASPLPSLYFNSSNCFILHRFHSFKQLIRWGRLFLPATGARSSR